VVSHFMEAPPLLAVAETGSFPCFHTVGSTTLPSSDGRLRRPGDPGASIVSSNLTIRATASNFHRAVLRRRPGEENSVHIDFRPVNARGIWHSWTRSTVGKTLNLRKAFHTPFQAFLSRFGKRKSADYRYEGGSGVNRSSRVNLKRFFLSREKQCSD
jgi:hypothetical protein